MAAIIGALVLVYTGSRVFVELDDSINAIWSTPAVHALHPVSPFEPVLATLQSRLLALVMMIVLGLLLIVVILASVLTSAYAGVLEKFPLLGVWIGPAISVFMHYGLLSAFFTLIYKWLPTGGVPWRYALIGGAVIALLFAAGNRALVYYFEVTQLTSAFGATAGFAAIMVWMYWTALAILLGAQIGRSTRDVLIQGAPTGDGGGGSLRSVARAARRLAFGRRYARLRRRFRPPARVNAPRTSSPEPGPAACGRRRRS